MEMTYKVSLQPGNNSIIVTFWKELAKCFTEMHSQEIFSRERYYHLILGNAGYCLFFQSHGKHLVIKSSDHLG